MRPILAVVIGAVIAALLAWLACYVFEHTELPDWLCTVGWVVALVAWLVWSFPRYFSRWI